MLDLSSLSKGLRTVGAAIVPLFFLGMDLRRLYREIEMSRFIR
jgi:hypothetical protein